MFGNSVQLIELGPRDGTIRGKCGRYQWEARMARGAVSYGLDPQSLYKGGGRIVRLVLYEPLARNVVGRKIAAYDRGWLYGRKEHLRTIERVVRYLERA